jgi:ribosomal protein S4
MFNSYFLSVADKSNINNNNNSHIQNKYNPNTDNNNGPLQSISQIQESAYTKIKREPTKFWKWQNNTSLNSMNSLGYNEISAKLLTF